MSEDSTKDKILSVANKLFTRFGFHKTSMDEIAKIARKAKGSLYYHFASKEDLFKEVVSKELTLIKHHLEFVSLNEAMTPTEKIKLYLIKRMELFNAATNYHETLKADFFEHFDFIDSLRQEFDNWERENIKSVILEGIKAEEFAPLKNIDVLLDMFVMILKGLEIPFYIQGKYQKYSPHFNELMQILTKGLS